jgi:hypothetical protein
VDAFTCVIFDQRALDFFRNTWMVQSERQALPVPVILGIDPGEAEDSGTEPWLEAVDPALPRPPEGAEGSSAPDRWWGEDSPLLAELDSLSGRR